MRPVAADDVKLVDSLLSDSLDDPIDIETAPRTAKNGAALVLQLPHILLIQLNPVILARIEPHVSELDSPHLGTPVKVDQTGIDLSDHHVQSRTKPAASHDCGLHL